MRLQACCLLHHVQPLSLHVLIIALRCRTVFHHRGQFLLVLHEKFLQVGIQLDLFVDQQQSEVHLIHALAHLIHIYFILSRLHLALLPGYLLLTLDGATVEYCLLHVETYLILIFLQSLEVKPHLSQHSPHLIGPRHHIALIRSLS